MTRPLRAMDKAAVLRDKIAEVNALADEAGVPRISLNAFARMDPAVCLRRIFTKLSQISVACGGDAIPRPLLHDEAATLMRLQDVITEVAAAVAGLGGGGGLDWVPENAVIHIDLVGGSPQARAWVQGAGVVSVDTLLGTDENAATGWDAGEYTPVLDDTLLAYGYRSVNPFAFIGAARTRIFEGFTMVLRLREHQNGSVASFAMLSADGNDALVMDVGHNTKDVQVYSWGGEGGVLVTNCLNVSDGDPNTNVQNAVAVTIVSDHVDLSVNGGEESEGALTTDDYPASLVAAILDLGNFAVQSITFYDPLGGGTGPIDTGENTAPTAIEVSSWGNGSPNGTFTEAEISLPLIPYTLASCRVTDAEANPCIITVQSSTPSIDVGVHASGLDLVLNEALTAGTYALTLRATDPGGLWVEDEISFTVVP